MEEAQSRQFRPESGSRMARSHNDRRGGLDRALVPFSSYRGPRRVRPRGTHEVKAWFKRRSASRKKIDEQSRTRSTSQETPQHRHDPSRSSRPSRHRSAGMRANPEPDSQSPELVPDTQNQSRLPHFDRIGVAPRDNSRRQQV